MHRQTMKFGGAICLMKTIRTMKKELLWIFSIMLFMTGCTGCHSDVSLQTIPKVRIECAVAYEFLQKEDEPCLFELTDSTHMVYRDEKAKIKLRGNSTAECPKRPFALKLSQNHSLCGMPEARKWVMLANYFDSTMLRNALAFRMSEQTNLEWTPHSCFAELFYNGAYKGIYQLCEKVEVGAHRVEIEQDGWLIEVDARVTEKDSYFRTRNMENPFRIEYPDKNLSEQRIEQLHAFFQQAEDALFADNFTDSIDGWRKYLNEDSWIDWFLINEIAKNNDAVFFSSCYMHSGTDGRIVMGPVWDFDLGYGNTPDNGCESPVGWHVRNSLWYTRLFEDPAFAQNVRKRFQFFYGNRSNYYSFIRHQAASLHQHVERNVSYDENIDKLLLWLEQRFDWLNKNL